MPPVRWVGIGLALTGFGGAMVLRERTAVGLGNEAVGLPVIAMVEVCDAVVAASPVLVAAVPAGPHPPVRKTSRPTTDHKPTFRGARLNERSAIHPLRDHADEVLGAEGSKIQKFHPSCAAPDDGSGSHPCGGTQSAVGGAGQFDGELKRYPIR